MVFLVAIRRMSAAAQWLWIATHRQKSSTVLSAEIMLLIMEAPCFLPERPGYTTASCILTQQPTIHSEMRYTVIAALFRQITATYREVAAAIAGLWVPAAFPIRDTISMPIHCSMFRLYSVSVRQALAIMPGKTSITASLMIFTEKITVFRV